MTTTEARRGHSLHAHTADEILEAWGPTREACLEEAATGLADSFAKIEHVSWWWHREVELTGTDEEILVALLEEIIYHLDAHGAVPTHVNVSRHGEGVLAQLRLTDLHRVAPLGAAPKGVSYSGLSFGEVEPGRWRCRTTVDV
jgi:SHS2 domain-containing protein